MPAHDLPDRIFDRAEAMGLGELLPRLSGLTDDRLRSIRSRADFTAWEFEAICRALAVDPAAMYRGEDSRPNRTPARFRAAMALDHPNGGDLRLLSLAVEQGRILAHVGALLGRRSTLAVHRSIRPPLGVRDTWREGYDLGEAARAMLWPGSGPIYDLGGLLRTLGVHVAEVRLSTRDIDAASVWEPNAMPVIVLNKASRRHGHPGALRATLAHELCHLLHDAGERELTTQVSWGSKGSGNYAELVEVRARAFAPAFLAPREQVRSWYGSQPETSRQDPRLVVRALAEHWGLSFEGAAWHAKNCSLLAPELADKLASQTKGPRLNLEAFSATPAGGSPSPSHPELTDTVAEPWDGLATELVLAALEEGHVTVGRARELLTWG